MSTAAAKVVASRVLIISPSPQVIVGPSLNADSRLPPQSSQLVRHPAGLSRAKQLRLDHLFLHVMLFLKSFADSYKTSDGLDVVTWYDRMAGAKLLSAREVTCSRKPSS